MVQTQAWVEALKISSKKLKEWSALAPDGVPVLVYVLQEGHASTEQYLAWASQHYNLPVLGEDFFKNAFDTDNARSLQFTVMYDWKPWVFPVEQWDGVTYVACVEPIDVNLGEGVRFVLADPRIMQAYWTQMASSFTGTSLDKLKPDGDKAEAPIGLNSNNIGQPFKLDLGTMDESQLFRTEAPAADAPSAPAPETVKESPPGDSLGLQLTIPKMAPVSLIEDAESSPLHRMPSETSEPKLEPEMPAGMKAPPPIPAAAPAPVAKAPPPIPGAPAKTAPAIPMPAANPEIKPKPVVLEKPAPPPIAKEQASGNVEEVFATLKGVYQHVFLMKCSGGKAHLYKWDPELKPANKTVAVDLAFPTFLRIISKTHLPYHGYLVDSPAHREFFNELKIADLPGCVTALPINGDNELLGVLVCVGEESLQKLDFLRKAEAMALGLLNSLRTTWSAGAAA
jgi:hypothetical protein